jgi:hypothetical protein
MFSIEGGARVTFEGISIAGTASTPIEVLDLDGGGTAVVVESTFSHATCDISDGSLTIDRSALSSVDIDDESGLLSFTRNTCSALRISVTGGSASIEGNAIDGADRMVFATGGFLTVENNLFTSVDPFADGIGFFTVVPGSTFRFNTMFNSSGIDDGGTALGCDSTLIATSNIIAWHATQFSDECQTTYTLYDTLNQQDGSGNQHLDPSTFFVDSAHGDFHLASSSPAIRHADPSQTLGTDKDGNPRPNPAGSTADCGALESPN